MATECARRSRLELPLFALLLSSGRIRSCQPVEPCYSRGHHQLAVVLAIAHQISPRRRRRALMNLSDLISETARTHVSERCLGRMHQIMSIDFHAARQRSRLNELPVARQQRSSN
jgi:hypothetical protein